MNEDRDVRVEPPKTELEQKFDKVAIPLLWSLLQAIDRLTHQLLLLGEAQLCEEWTCSTPPQEVHAEMQSSHQWSAGAETCRL